MSTLNLKMHILSAFWPSVYTETPFVSSFLKSLFQVNIFENTVHIIMWTGRCLIFKN